jgi:LysM repeat protein
MGISARSAILAGAMALTVAGAAISVAPAAATDRFVIVQPGDTLSQIALEQGVSVDQLVRLNGLSDPNYVTVGQRLRVSTNAAASTATPRQLRRHVVNWGENLTFIARRYQSTVTAIARLNDLADPSFVRAGTVLRIPGARSVRRWAAAGRHQPARLPIHVVAWGENVTWLAQRYHTTVGAIVRANHLTDASFIRAGQPLRIPGTRAPASFATPDAAMPGSMAALLAGREATRRVIVAEARRQGVPPAFALAVAWQESGWQQEVVSPAGAIGVMQLLPASADWIGLAMLGEPINPYSLRDNVRAGVALLHHYVIRYGGSRALALAAYYQGERATDLHGIYPVSQLYIASILRLTQLFGG